MDLKLKDVQLFTIELADIRLQMITLTSCGEALDGKGFLSSSGTGNTYFSLKINLQFEIHIYLSIRCCLACGC